MKASKAQMVKIIKWVISEPLLLVLGSQEHGGKVTRSREHRGKMAREQGDCEMKFREQ